MSAIFASPNPTFQQDLWDYIKCLGLFLKIPWLLIGF